MISLSYLPAVYYGLKKKFPNAKTDQEFAMNSMIFHRVRSFLVAMEQKMFLTQSTQKKKENSTLPPVSWKVASPLLSPPTLPSDIPSI